MWEWRDACHCGVNVLFWCQVTVSGTTVMFSRSRGNVTELSLLNGVTYTVSVVARNSVGASETFTGSFNVPCE